MTRYERAGAARRFLLAERAVGAVLASTGARRRWPASTRSTTPGRPTGLWRAHRPSPARVGAGGGPHRRLPGHVARRGRGPLAADPRPLGRLRRPRPWSSPSAASTAHRARGELRAPPGRAVRRPGPVAEPAHGPWGRVVRGSDMARGGWYGVVGEALTGWWLAARRSPGSPTCESRSPNVRPASPDWPWASNPTRRMPPAPPVRSGWRARGSADETRMDDQQHALAGLLRTIPIVEADDASGPDGSSGLGDDAPSGGCGPPRWCLRSTPPAPRSGFHALGARASRCRPGRARRGDRRARRVRRRDGRPAARRARCQRAVVPHRRRDRGRAGGRRRPVPATTAAEPALAGWQAR